jgi:hypothetical protein
MKSEDKPSEEFERFDKAMDKIMSVSKEELDRRLAEAKAAKTGKRYTLAFQSAKHPPNFPFTSESSYRFGNSTISPWRSRAMMFAASSGETIFVKSFSKVPTFTAHHLWVWSRSRR